MLTIAGGILIAGFAFFVFCVIALVVLTKFFNRTSPSYESKTITFWETLSRGKRIGIVCSVLTMVALACIDLSH
jgi:hypothetical protein